MTLRPAHTLTFAALALSSSLALAQPSAPPPPTQPPAPVERQPPSGRPGFSGTDRGNMPPREMQSGMQDDRQVPMGRPSFHGQGMQDRRDFHRGPGGFHRGQYGGMHMGPGGMWWKDPMLVQRLTLTSEQTRRMDGIFQESRLQLIDLKANVEKQEVILEPLLSANPLDTTRAMEQIDKVAQSRADLEKANAKMLLGIRAVLTPEQWTRLNERRGPGDFRPPSSSAPQPPAGRTRGLRGAGAKPGSSNSTGNQ